MSQDSPARGAAQACGAARPPVSVIIIFLSGGEFLREAIESVLQSYHNWELLLVDDGSTDRSSAIAAEHGARLGDKVRLLEHLAGSASRNSVCFTLPIHSQNKNESNESATLLCYPHFGIRPSLNQPGEFASPHSQRTATDSGPILSKIPVVRNKGPMESAKELNKLGSQLNHGQGASALDSSMQVGLPIEARVLLMHTNSSARIFTDRECLGLSIPRLPGAVVQLC